MTKRNNNIKIIKKTFVLLAAGIAIILLGIALELTNVINIRKSPAVTAPTDSAIPQQTNTVDYGPPREEDSVTSPEKITTPMPDSKSTNTSAEISVLITRASRSSVGMFIEKIDTGICVLTVTQSGIEKIKMESAVIQERDYSTCQGFDLDSTKLDSTPLTIKLSVISGSRSGSAVQEVN